MIHMIPGTATRRNLLPIHVLHGELAVFMSSPLRLVARHVHHGTRIIFLNHFLEMLLFAWLPVVPQRTKSGHVSSTLRLVARHAHHETRIVFLNHFLEMLLFAWLPVVLQRPKSGHVSPPFVFLMVVPIMRTTLRLPLFVTRFQEESRGATISMMSLLSRTATVSVAHYRYHIM